MSADRMSSDAEPERRRLTTVVTNESRSSGQQLYATAGSVDDALTIAVAGNCSCSIGSSSSSSGAVMVQR